MFSSTIDSGNTIMGGGSQASPLMATSAVVVNVPTVACTPFKSSQSLQTNRSTSQSVRLATNAILNDSKSFSIDVKKSNVDTTTTTTTTTGIMSDISEARYWSDSFGLVGGGSTNNHNIKPSKRAGGNLPYRGVDLEASSASIVHQVAFTNNTNIDGSTKRTTLAVVAGPRVQLYGTSTDCTFHRTLLPVSNNFLNEGSGIVTLKSADRQIPTAGQLAICSSFRADGRLVAVGTDRGSIRISDCTSRATLCQFHTNIHVPIRSVHWFRNGQYVLSAGDDATVRVWQLKQNQQQNKFSTTSGNSSGLVLTCKGHGDTIRCAVLWQLSEKQIVAQQKNNKQQPYPYKSLAATGSYDHTIRLWNMEDLDNGEGNDKTSRNMNESDRCVSVLQHGSPVEALIWMTSDSTSNNTSISNSTLPPVWLISAGAITVKVWNPMNGTCISTIQTQHRKTITCLLAMPRIFRYSFNNTLTTEYRMRLLTGGLDGLIRIHTFDRSNGRIQHLHGIRINKYAEGSATVTNAPPTMVGITALATTQTADRIAIGTTTGTVLVRQKVFGAIDVKRTKEPRAGTYAFFTRGMNADPIPGDQIVSSGTSSRKRKLANHDILLKKFRYGEALDEAIETRQPQSIMCVLEELGKRRGLKIALSNRNDEESLEPILSFIVKYITRPQYCEVLIGVANMIIDLYGSIGHSDIIDELLNKLRREVAMECRLQKSVFTLLGHIDAMMTTAEMGPQYTI